MRAPKVLATLMLLAGVSACGYGVDPRPEEEDATSPPATERAGQLDATYGTNGMARVPFGGDDAGGYFGLDVIGDQIVAAGWGMGGLGGIRFRLARLTASGTLDPSFGEQGQVLTGWAPSTGDAAYAVSVGHQADGSIIAIGWRDKLGSASADIALARYKADGSLDAGFGTSGKSLIDLGGEEEVTRGLVLPNDTILVAGRRDEKLLVARATPKGTLDTSFAAPTGYFALGIGKSTVARGVVVDAQGRILVAGTAELSSRRAVVVLRLTADGTLDTAFGEDGTVVVDDPYDDESAVSIALSPDGRIVVASERGPENAHELRVRRFLVDGSLDPAFGRKGVAGEMTIVGDARPLDLVVLLDGGVVVVGNSGGGKTLLVRYTSDGAVDEMFGVHGLLRVYVGEYGVLHTVRLDTQGRLLLGGADVGETPGPGTYGVVVRMWM